ncbi:MAG: undecaprenyl-diphosphate phosphatase, partial [Candidatus Competibacteraceae bacterium]|jgi:undecaprenyl-diphosphatase|nr:undecaprenyl-diphosphate phosphatase [Candidatus Competibacteraceae bacterium]
VPVLTGWQDQGLAFDIAVHVGTLSAVVLYFRAELIAMTGAWLNSLRGRGLTPDARLAWAVLFGTIPVGLAGLLLKDFIESDLRSPLVIAAATIGFGLALWWADAKGRRQRDELTLDWKDVLVIGCAQAISLIPGTSRSGITMTAGLAMGLTRQASARFSFLLSIPVIVLAGGLTTLDLVAQPESAQWGVIGLGVLLSGISAYLCIHFFLKLLERIGMLPFVIYRLVLGVGLLVLFY